MVTVHLEQELRDGPLPLVFRDAGRRHAREGQEVRSPPSRVCRKGVGNRETKERAGSAFVLAAPLRSAPPAPSPPCMQICRRGGSARQIPGTGLQRLVLSRPPSPPTYCPQELRRRNGERRGEEMGEQKGSDSARERTGAGFRMDDLLIAPPRGQDPGEGRGRGCWAQRDPAPACPFVGWGLCCWGGTFMVGGASKVQRACRGLGSGLSHQG